MAVRLNRRHSDLVRERIRASQLVRRLQNHAFGEVEMTNTQVDSAKFLLNKIIPNPPERKELSGPDGGPVQHSLSVGYVDPAPTET